MKRLGGIAIPMAAQLLKQFGKDFFKAISTVIQQPSPGAVWISSLTGDWGTWKGKLCSMYFHPTKEHGAWTDGKNGVKRSIENPCEWAISCQTRALWGNKSGYTPFPP